MLSLLQPLIPPKISVRAFGGMKRHSQYTRLFVASQLQWIEEILLQQSSMTSSILQSAGQM